MMKKKRTIFMVPRPSPTALIFQPFTLLSVLLRFTRSILAYLFRFEIRVKTIFNRV